MGWGASIFFATSKKLFSFLLVVLVVVLVVWCLVLAAATVHRLLLLLLLRQRLLLRLLGLRLLLRLREEVGNHRDGDREGRRHEARGASAGENEPGSIATVLRGVHDGLNPLELLGELDGLPVELPTSPLTDAAANAIDHRDDDGQRVQGGEELGEEGEVSAQAHQVGAGACQGVKRRQHNGEGVGVSGGHLVWMGGCCSAMCLSEGARWVGPASTSIFFSN